MSGSEDEAPRKRIKISEPLRGQIRQPRSSYSPGYSPSEDNTSESVDIVGEDKGGSSNHSSSRESSASRDTSSGSSTSGSEENSLDSLFGEHTEDTSKVNTQALEGAEDFYKILVPKECRGQVPRSALNLVIPNPGERPYDHSKGLCIYRKMPYCGFRLPLSPFVRELLQIVNVSPSQLTAPAWCYIASFEEIFRQFTFLPTESRPTVPLFFRLFSLNHASPAHVALKKRGKSVLIFNTGLTRKFSKVDGWKESWVYLENFREVESLEGIRETWRSLSAGKNLAPDVRKLRTSPLDDFILAELTKYFER